MVDLSHVTCFRSVPAAALAALARTGYLVEPRDGALVFAQGDPADAGYAIIGGSGAVRIGSTSGQGKALMAELFHLNDLFGEIGVLDNQDRTADAVVDGKVQLWRIGAEAFLEELRRTPALGLGLSLMLARRLRRTYALLQGATFATVESRLADQLLYLAEVSGREVANGIRLSGRFRQGALADLLGATSRSIITILNQWRTAGVIAYDTVSAQITIHQPAALRAISLGARGGASDGGRE